jgi:hypothetical protein
MFMTDKVHGKNVHVAWREKFEAIISKLYNTEESDVAPDLSTSVSI